MRPPAQLPDDGDPGVVMVAAVALAALAIAALIWLGGRPVLL